MTTQQLQKILGLSGLILSGFLAAPLLAQAPSEVKEIKGTKGAKELNLYSARHYQTDEALYSNFTKKTGIKINRIEADDNALAER